MNYNQKILQQHPEIFNFISVKDISLLCDLDEKIKIIKHGRFKYYKMLGHDLDDIKNFINNLNHDTIFTLIPFISINARYDEPFTILSQQILITKNSNPVLLANFIDNKIFKAFELFNANFDYDYYTIFKYKSIEIDFNSYKKFR
jgi:hypothetical protein